MTLGGFALAIGRLVDDSTVVLENINRHLAEGKAPADAARDGANEVALAVLASTITTIIVFSPVMFLFGVAKSLFSALSLAVVLSMLASYVVAMTVIPVFCAHFLTAESAREAEEGTGRGFLAAFIRSYDRFAERYEHLLDRVLNHKGAVVAAASILFVVSMAAFPLLGTELFPRTDAGQFVIQFRAPLGTRIELTEQLAERLENTIRDVIPPADLSTVVSNLGLAPGFSSIYSSNAASDSGFVMVALKPDHRVSTWDYVAKLKSILPARMPEIRTFFSSGSIIDSVLNFGLAAPIDIQVSGRHYAELFDLSRKVDARVKSLPEVAGTFIPEESNYPTLRINVDRVKAARLGLNQRDVVTNVITALTSNQMIAPSIWIDPKSGNDYFLTAQYDEDKINSLDTLRDIPVRSSDGDHSRADALLLRNVATITREKHPAEADHFNIQRVVDVLVAPSTDDMGGTLTAVQKALANLELPAGTQIAYRGSVESMQKSFSSFGYGLAMAVVLLYLVMVAQFRSFLDPFIIMFAVPMGLIGVVWTLYPHRHDAQHRVVHGNHRDGRDRRVQRDPAGGFRQSALPRRPGTAHGNHRVGENPHAPDSDDDAGDGRGPDADGAQAGRRLRSFRPARARRRRRTRSFDTADAVPGPRALRNLLQPSSAGVEMNRYICPHNRGRLHVGGGEWMFSCA